MRILITGSNGSALLTDVVFPEKVQLVKEISEAPVIENTAPLDTFLLLLPWNIISAKETVNPAPVSANILATVPPLTPLMVALFCPTK